MESLYNLPNGDSLHLVDTATVSELLPQVLELFRAGGTEPVFFGDQARRPEGVLISFGQWSEYEARKAEAEADRRVEDITRERLATARPEDWVPFEDAAREGDWDLDVEDGESAGDSGNRRA